jgi:hypothetical protein
MRQRKKEVDALIEVLSSPHESVDDLADEVWRLVDSFRRDRDVFVIATRLAGGVNMLFGPYESKTIAQKDVDVGSVKAIDTGDRYMLMKVLSPSKIFETSTPTLFDVR